MAFSFKEWYARNGERLNEKRRSLYEQDPEYRKRVLATNQTSREKRKKDESPEQRMARRREAKLNKERYKVVESVEDGKTVRLFTIGALAEALGCSIAVLRLWERQKVIPPTPRRTNGKTGDRLYSEQQVENIRKILTAQGRLPIVSTSPKDDQQRPLLRYIRSAGGKNRQVELYLIGTLAQQVRRNVVTLEHLESIGALPETPFRTSSVGRRLYTMPMIDAVRQAFEARGDDVRGEEAWKSFHAEIVKAWKALGVVGAVLVEAVPEEKSTANANGKKQRSSAGA